MVALPAAWLQAGWPAPGARDLAATAYTGIVTAGVGYLLYSMAMRHIAPATGVTLALAEPVTAFVLAVLVVGERPGWPAVGGGLLVLGGLLVVVLAAPVLMIELRADGHIRRIDVLRVPKQAKDTVQMAIDAIRRVAPLSIARGVNGPLVWSETFLFDEQRRFKPRSLE